MVYKFVSVGHGWTHVLCLGVSNTPIFGWEKCLTYHRVKPYAYKL